MTSREVRERLNQLFNEGLTVYKYRDMINSNEFNTNNLKEGRVFTVYSKITEMHTVVRVTKCTKTTLTLEHRDLFNWSTTLKPDGIPDDCEFAWLNDFEEEV